MDITRYSDPPWVRIARIVFGAAFGTTIIVFADVQVSLSRMHFADASTMPNLAPQIRYLFIPLLLVIALAASIVVDVLIWVLRVVGHCAALSVTSRSAPAIALLSPPFRLAAFC